MSTTVVPADAPHTGTSYYVPEVRVVRLADTIKREGEVGDPLPGDVLRDILSVEVTRVSTGPSQYKLTLNNFYLSTARDRRGHEDEFERMGAREPSSSLPVWPRFKYNDFDVLEFGRRLRIDMRYVPEKGAAAAGGGQTSDGWTPMISGPITDMGFTFGAAEGARLTIGGEDDLSVLKDKLERRFPFSGERLGELELVRRTLQKANDSQHGNYPITTIARPLVDRPPFVSDDGQGLHEAIQTGQSYLDFIQKLAERLDFEVFLEFASLDDPASPLEFHFEPCRARARGVGFRLDRERNLLEFKPTIKVVDQYSEVRVRGRHRDPQLAQAARGRALPDVVKDELHRGPDDGELTPGGKARDEFFRNRPNKHTVPNRPNMDDVRAEAYAEAVMRKKAREFFTVEATTLGMPRLRPGHHVEIRGLRTPFDGFYYVTQATTFYGGDGMRTKLTASRPGMEMPPHREQRRT